MSEDSQLKRKAKKILLGLGITSIVGGGLFFKHKHDQLQDAKINTEWKQQHLDAEEIVADAQTAHFVAKRNPNKQALDSLSKLKSQLNDKRMELDKARCKLEDKLNAQLYAAAQKKDAKKYIALRDSMIKNEAYIDYNQERESGVSLNDLLTANANSDNALWIAINRKRGNCDERKYRDDRVNTYGYMYYVANLVKDVNDDFKIVEMSCYAKAPAAYPYDAEVKKIKLPEDSQEKVNFKDFLKEKPASTISGIDKQLAIYRGFEKYMSAEANSKAISGYIDEQNGEEVKEALLKKALEREGKS